MLDMLIEMKSIPVIVEMMRKHPSRDKIYSDASRALLAISAKPENLKLIVYLLWIFCFKI